MPFFTCRESDIRRIKIQCRCGERSIAEVPQQLARGQTMHPCPRCGTCYSIHQLDNGAWEIKRMEERVEEMTYEEVSRVEVEAPTPPQDMSTKVMFWQVVSSTGSVLMTVSSEERLKKVLDKFRQRNIPVTVREVPMEMPEKGREN